MLGGRWVGLGAANVVGTEKGVRVICVDRPGTGGSTRVQKNRVAIWLGIRSPHLPSSALGLPLTYSRANESALTADLTSQSSSPPSSRTSQSRTSPSSPPPQAPSTSSTPSSPSATSYTRHAPTSLSSSPG